ncbi:MAG: helix-turn-helix transcriptional regulator [Candidatus Limnocylindrales bacterium]
MPTRKRAPLASEASRLNREQLTAAGREVRASRLRRRLTQDQLAFRVGMDRSMISRAERGDGAGITLGSWQRIAVALGRPLRLEFGRDPQTDPADAGHLRIQELVLRLARQWGDVRSFELPTKPASPAYSADVGLRDNRSRRLVLAEAWNTFGDLGAARRSTARKLAEAQGLAAVYGADGPPFSAHACWVVRATRANRGLVVRYPEVFAAALPGSSREWVRALTLGTPPPKEPGMVWCDVSCTRLLEWRRR